MSHALAKKIDKIVSKIANKHKEPKSHTSDPTEYHFNHEEAINNDGNDDNQHESILQRMKGHLGHANKAEHHYHHPEGVPPSHVIINDLKDSPFKGMNIYFSHLCSFFSPLTHHIYVHMN